MSPSVVDAAKYILAQYPHGISTRKLQKLAYFSQGWSLALQGKPIFADDFEAWQYGPVSRRLFALHRGMYVIREDDLIGGDSTRLTEGDRVVINAVIQNYGGLSGDQLSILTHVDGSPWSTVRNSQNLDALSSGSEVISKEIIKAYFQDLLTPAAC